MALNSSRKGWLGVGVESTFGTAAPMNDNVFWTTNTLEGVHKPIENDAAYAQRQKTFSAVTGTKWGTGDVEFYLDPSVSGYFLAGAMGSTSKTTVSGSVVRHTHALSQSNTPYSLSLYNDRVVSRLVYTGASVDKFEVKVSNGLTTAKATINSLFPVTSTSGTVTPTANTLFTWGNYSYQTGATFAAAGAASALPLTDINFTINNNTEVIYESGQNAATRIGQKNFQAMGSMTAFFETTTERDAYYALTNGARIVTFSGAGSGTTQEKIAFNFYNSYFDTFSVNTGIDNFFVEKQSWVSEYSVADSKTMDIVQVNSNSNY
ncbi:MAG: phage tail tube protein [Patescibacteria group bacterium]|nr:phage tail tube protein [Patescibacteria group bacterium]